LSTSVRPRAITRVPALLRCRVALRLPVADRWALGVIALLLLLIWLEGARHSFVPCTMDCGETFIAQHAVQNVRLYGIRYGLVQDHATAPDPSRPSFLYTHNLHLGTLLFPLLDAVGLNAFWPKQIATLLAFGAGLFYAYKLPAHVAHSRALGLVTLGLFATDYLHVFSFGLNALRAWHWLSLLGLSYHVHRSVTADEPTKRDYLGIVACALLAFLIGYEFAAICASISFFLVVLCGSSVRLRIRTLLYVFVTLMGSFALRQLQIIAVLGLNYWLDDLLYSSSIKLTALAQVVSLPPLADIDAYYANRGVLRPFSAPAPLYALWAGAQRMSDSMILPTFGIGATVCLALATVAACATLVVAVIRAVRRRPRITTDARGVGLGLDVERSARYFAALVLGIPLGMLVFGALSVSVYLKHQFPLLAAPFFLAMAAVLVALSHLVWRPRNVAQRAIALVAAVAMVVLIVDHLGTQVGNVRATRAMSTAWIPEIEKRSDASVAVSWIPSAAAAFTRGGVVSITPGREIEVAARLHRGAPPFNFDDLLEINPRMASLEDRYHLLRPDYWLYFPTDHRAEVDETATMCQRTWAGTVFDALFRPPVEPRIVELNLATPSVRPGRTVGYSAMLNGTGRDIERLVLRADTMPIATARPTCDERVVRGSVWVPPQRPNGPWTVAIEAVRYDGKRVDVGTVSIPVSDTAPDTPVQPVYGPRRQPSPDELAAAIPSLPVAAQGPDFILFDLRSLWSRR
jgi:hypothetical protein